MLPRCTDVKNVNQVQRTYFNFSWEKKLKNLKFKNSRSKLKIKAFNTLGQKYVLDTDDSYNDLKTHILLSKLSWAKLQVSHW